MAAEKFILMWAEENYNYYELSSILLNYGVLSKKQWGRGIEKGITFGKQGHAEFYLPEEELRKEAENWYRFLMDKKKFNFLLNQIEISGKEFTERMRDLLKKDLKNLTNEEFWEIYDYYWFKFGRFMLCYIASQPHRVAKLEEELLKFLEKKGVKDPFNYISILTAPKERILFSKEGNKLFTGSLLEMLGKEGSEIDRTLLNKKSYREVPADQKERNKIIRELKPPKKILHIAYVLRTLGHERFKMRFIWMPGLYYAELFLIEIKRRFRITKKELRMYDGPEVEQLIRHGKKVPDRTLDIRKHGFLKLLKNGKIRTFEGKSAEQFLKEAVKQPVKTEEIKGTIASTGHAVGSIVIFSYRNSREHAKKIKAMKPGDIVVSEMTRPNIITACEKASAIITDEGGTLCHAAIVSREIGIPCIIGTRVATRVLNDGDLVEVDANRGVIKKLTRKEYKLKKMAFTPHIKEARRQVLVKELPRLKAGNVLWLKDFNKKDLPTVGGKGSSLGELVSIGLPVPEAFCVTTNAYRLFVNSKIKNKIHKLFHKFDPEDLDNVGEISRKIKSLFLQTELSHSLAKDILVAYQSIVGKVAVRSSGVAEDLEGASFAGQHDTYLNIMGEKNVIKAVKSCFASLFTPRVILYRHNKGFSLTNVTLAVVVQEMVDAKFAGVMFTINPVNKNKNEVVIEVVKGLGEKLVSGQVTPSSYVLEKSNAQVTEKNEIEAALSNGQLKALVDYGKKIERHYGKPMDIEFAIDKKDKLFILQARPVTA